MIRQTPADHVIIEDAKTVGQSDKALKVVVAGKSLWIPKSQIHEDSECYKPDTSGTLVIPEWLAIDKGLV